MIGKTIVSYFPFSWIDTSAIGVLNLGEVFENYEVENKA